MTAHCRFCNTALHHSFVDLGMSPLSNGFLKQTDLNRMEPYFPLRAFVCDRCFLVQLEEFERPERIFDDYAYFSSYSESWLTHARHYVDCMMERLRLTEASHVVEIACNDGYLLQYFDAKGIPVLGIEPAANVAAAAEAKGIPVVTEFFGRRLAKELEQDGKQADLIVGNNVIAHVPDLNDFVAGMQMLLSPDGTITIEFPHLLRLIEDVQFDTIYHEHFSYFSFVTIDRVFSAHGLRVYDVDELSTHGGSLRIYACHSDASGTPVSPKVADLRRREREAGMETIETYTRFADRVPAIKADLLAFLIDAKRAGKSVVGYGAPAKGNTLLNYCGVGPEFIAYTVDRNPHKQGRYLPGTHIPIHAPEKMAETRPDYVLVLPWNLKSEIVDQMAYIREWGGRFVVPIPCVEVMP